MKKTITFFLLLVILLNMAACSEKTEKTSPLLVKSVTVYHVDYETGEWTEWEKTDLDYENSYPKTITTEYPDSDYRRVNTFEYTLEDGVPVAMTRYLDGALQYSAEYVKGRLSQVSYSYELAESTRYLTYIYANDDDYFTLVLHSSHVGDPADPSAAFYNTEEVDTISVTTKDGLLQTTVNRGLYTNWLDGEDRDWLRFNGTYTANYDSEGILSSTSCEYRDDQVPQNYLFEITMENGLVTEVVRKIKSADSDEAVLDAKIVFEYTDIQIDASRYSRMINAFIIEEGNTFYIYNWY
ncbi:MAG: hypothetical protein J5589_05955 [Firmicutes bacterium]|nr:hypothetical protein [Bacillota bacterium]